MMVKLLVYAYWVGKSSSRRIERANYQEVAFRVLSGNQHPDHDRISDFRKRHLDALGALFAQVLDALRSKRPPLSPVGFRRTTHVRHGELEGSGRAPLER
jgi:hypothetical protein